ncbi:MAG: hypothetical protein ACRCZR_08365 [Cetobacterium sp.]
MLKKITMTENLALKKLVSKLKSKSFVSGETNFKNSFFAAFEHCCIASDRFFFSKDDLVYLFDLKKSEIDYKIDKYELALSSNCKKVIFYTSFIEAFALPFFTKHFKKTKKRA